MGIFNPGLFEGAGYSGGNNNGAIYDNNGIVATSALFTWNPASSTLSATNITSNGAGSFNSIIASNVQVGASITLDGPDGSITTQSLTTGSINLEFGDLTSVEDIIFANGTEMSSGSGGGIVVTLGNLDCANNCFFGDGGGGGIEVGANGDCYGVRRNDGTDPLELGYNDNIPGRGARFFGGGSNYGALKLMNSEVQYANLDTGLGTFTFSPIGSNGFTIDGANGGASVQLFVTGSSGAGNYAAQFVGGQVGLQASGTNGSTTGQGYVGYGFGPIAAFYASSGDYSLYGNTGTLFNSGIVQFGNKITQYNTKTTAGYGIPAILAAGRQTGKIAAQTLTSYTNTASDGSFTVSANINVTTSTAYSFTVTCTYTDETNVSRVATLAFQQLAGTSLNTITNVTGAGPYEGIPLHIRVKASTTITIATVGTFTTVTYNGEGIIEQKA